MPEAVGGTAERVALQAGRVPPHSAEAECGVLGSILLESHRVLDLCLERQLAPESFYVPAHRLVFEAVVALARDNQAVDLLTVGDRLRTQGQLEGVGGMSFLTRLVDATPTAAHAEYYIDLVRQNHLLRCIIGCAQDAQAACYGTEESADLILSQVEQAFLNITEHQHGSMRMWEDAVKGTMEHVEHILVTRKGLNGLSSGFVELDRKLQGMKPAEMIVLAARPSMGKTSLAMNIVEHVALGQGDPDRKPHAVGVFSLEMSQESLVLRMLCSHARVSSFKLSEGYISQQMHAQLTQAASVLLHAPVFLDDTGGLDVMEMRARARRMKKKYQIEMVVVDYLQLLRSLEYARHGRQIEVQDISANLKAMAKELNIPVLVLSQLSRAPEQRDSKHGKPKLSDLRDSGAIEQDADVVLLLRRPCRYPEDEEAQDETLAIVDVAKQRNGPVGEVRLNFDENFTRFTDRTHGTDGPAHDFAEIEVEDGV